MSYLILSAENIKIHNLNQPSSFNNERSMILTHVYVGVKMDLSQEGSELTSKNFSKESFFQ